MGRRLVLALAFGASAGGAHAEGNGLLLTGGGGQLVLLPADLVSVSAATLGGQADVTITLTADAGQRLAAFTADRIGDEVAVKSCGRVLLRTVIVEPINNGGLTIGGLDLDQARGLRAVALGEVACPG